VCACLHPIISIHHGGVLSPAATACDVHACRQGSMRAEMLQAANIPYEAQKGHCVGHCHVGPKRGDMHALHVAMGDGSPMNRVRV
jgi:hypothetical protein